MSDPFLEITHPEDSDVLALLFHASLAARAQRLSFSKMQVLDLLNMLDSHRGDSLPATVILDFTAAALHQRLSRDPAFETKERARRRERDAKLM